MTSVVDRWSALSADRSYVLLDGFHAVKHALRFGAAIPLAVTDRRDEVLRLAGELAPDIVEAMATRLHELAEDRFLQVVAKPHLTRVAALALRPSPAELRHTLYTGPRQAPAIVLDNPRNLGNVGAVVRLAAGFAAAGVITTGTVDPWHPQVIRGGAGLHFATAVMSAAEEDLPPGELYALDPAGDDIRDLAIPDDALLAFGSERRGISPRVRQRADQLVALPMRAKVSSYNLATSVAMTLFHWSAQPRQDR